MAEQYANAASTTLNGLVSSGASAIVVTSATGFPSTAPFRVLVRAEGANTNELMLVTAGAGTTTWTVTRAVEPYGGVQAASAHASGAVVKQVLTTAGLLAAAAAGTERFGVTFDGGGAAPAAGSQSDTQINYNGTITGWTMLADTVGSAIIDIWKDTYGNSPPTVADTITAAAKPTLSSAAKSTSTTLTGWTTAVSAGDVVRFNLDSASTLTRVTLIVSYTKT